MQGSTALEVFLMNSHRNPIEYYSTNQRTYHQMDSRDRLSTRNRVQMLTDQPPAKES